MVFLHQQTNWHNVPVQLAVETLITILLRNFYHWFLHISSLEIKVPEVLLEKPLK